MSAFGDDPVLAQLADRLANLEVNCLAGLDEGLNSVLTGDNTHSVVPSTRPIDAVSEDPAVQALAEAFNRVLGRTQNSLMSYNELREQQRHALGERSVFDGLVSRLHSLHDNCLTNLEASVRAANQGDLTVAVVSLTTRIDDSQGSIGELGELFNSMLAKAQATIESYEQLRARLSTVIREVQQNALTVAGASEQMATTSEEAGRAVGEIATAVSDVARGAERQVRTVEEAKVMALEVVGASQASAANAQETASAAEEARVFAEEGAGAVADATEAMEAVKESSEEATEAIRSLGDKSSHIGGIVATITGIAQQTNLLALNAAIEAARAGEQGRGFAVVADEVRKLAEESQAAAASISELIREIQKETARAVEVVETGAQRTEDGVAKVELARSSFAKIGAAVEDVNGRVGQISSSVEQIADSSHRMQTSMDDVARLAELSSAATQEVSASTEQTSASAEQIAASAQELAATATGLERLVAQFTVA
jgi:methyl-accepting chemotaxis protein